MFLCALWLDRAMRQMPQDMVRVRVNPNPNPKDMPVKNWALSSSAYSALTRSVENDSAIRVWDTHRHRERERERSSYWLLSDIDKRVEHTVQQAEIIDWQQRHQTVNRSVTCQQHYLTRLTQWQLLNYVLQQHQQQHHIYWITTAAQFNTTHRHTQTQTRVWS